MLAGVQQLQDSACTGYCFRMVVSGTWEGNSWRTLFRITDNYCHQLEGFFTIVVNGMGFAVAGQYPHRLPKRAFLSCRHQASLRRVSQCKFRLP